MDCKTTGRALRLMVVRGYYQKGQLSREHALELLAGQLTPGKEETRVDDSGLLDASVAEVSAALGYAVISKKEEGDGQ